MPEDTRIRVLFVDDDPNVLNLLEATIAALRREWDGAVASSGERALELLKTREFDVVVSDMRMPGMTGCELLNRVLREHPGSARIIMSGFTDEDTLVATVGAAHQFLPKPFELKALRALMARIRKITRHVNAAPIRALASRIASVPSIPSAYHEMLEVTSAADASTERLAQVVGRDPAMTAKLLQLVNSAFFGFARECSRPSEAIQLLGLIRVRALVLGLHIFSAFNHSTVKEFNLDQVWQHSLRTGLFARRIVEEEGGRPEMLEQGFSSGLLHDLGVLALAAFLPEDYREVLDRARTQQRPLIHVERELLGATHAELGGHILGLWGLPTPLVEAVFFHHEPIASDDGSFCVATAVHAAEVLARKGNYLDTVGNPIDQAYLNRLGLDDRAEVWRAATSQLG
jgi:HD-like signal output (HDOD) protein